ncbi:MAG: hypothetical protein ACOH5I_23160 [Oligoflexus sp.]
MFTTPLSMRQVAVLATIALFFMACGPETKESLSQLHERWDHQNRPELFGFDRNSQSYAFTHQFADLPLEAQLTERPWSGDYWPTYKGGITYRWDAPVEVELAEDASDEERAAAYEKAQIKLYAYDLTDFDELDAATIAKLSPAEKYDLYTGQRHYPLTTEERQRTRILKTVPWLESYDANFRIPTWEGLCHAWAPLVIHYKNPAPVVLEGALGHQIPFGSSDIQALLNIFVHYDRGQTDFLGQRCNIDFSQLKTRRDSGEITHEQFLAIAENEHCKGTNAGAFHIVLANQIALKNRSFVMDKTRDFEVWNQPIEAYTSEVVAEHEGASAGAAPGTVREVELKTRVSYTTEIAHSYELYAPSYSTAYEYYHYRLELDGNDEIIGGAWISDNRPDFLWKQKISDFYGRFHDLGKIYQASIAYLQKDEAKNSPK